MSTAHDRPALEAVLFDMDGVLVDTEPLWFEVESEIAARLGRTWTAADQAHLVGGSLDRSVGYLLATAAWAPAPETVARWMVDGMVARIAERGVALLPGAARLLAEAAAAGLPRALVTSSGRCVMDAVLAHLTMPIAPFDVTVCAADVGHAKPDPEPYLLAAARLGADPARCVVVEDAPGGVAAAEAAGCMVVVVPGVAPVPPGAGRVMVGSLTGVSVGWLRELAALRNQAADDYS